MTDSRRRMERLLQPRARVEPEGAEQPIPEARIPLPRWQTIPLDAKFPVLPAPKGEVTFVTTKLGQAPFKSSQRKDFDLTDPYNRATRSDYKALFDPYLKGWFSKPHVQKQMRKQKLLTDRGNVSCSVRDFNDYRMFLRKQALMKGTGASVGEDLEEAKERRKTILAKTKMKAEVFGIEVKYKSLKAQQAAKQLEDEKRSQFLNKTESEEERQRQKVMEEEKQYFAALKKNQDLWNKKQDIIKQRDQQMRRKAEERLVQFEMEAQDKLNKLDYLREQRFYELDQRRKLNWRARRLHQLQEMENAQKSERRVQAEMRTVRRRYEMQMARQMARDDVTLDLRKEARFKNKEINQEMYARRMAKVLKDTRYMTFSRSDTVPSGTSRHGSKTGTELTRQASIWMVQEVLNRLGLTEESWRLKKPGHMGTISYLNDLDRALSASIRKLEGMTVLGEEQEMLSRLAHLAWRAVKTAYPGKAHAMKKIKSTTSKREASDKQEQGEEGAEEEVEGEHEEEEIEMTQDEETEHKIMQETRDDVLTTGEELAWFFPDDDDGEEREQAVKITMLVTGELERKLDLPLTLGDPRPKAQQASREVEERMDEFFRTRMRMTETDALAVEAELVHFLESLKETEISPKEMKSILTMCIKLINHDVIEKSDPCGELETNPYGHTYLAFDNEEGKVEGEMEGEAEGGEGEGEEEAPKSSGGKDEEKETERPQSEREPTEQENEGEGEGQKETEGEAATTSTAGATEEQDTTENANSSIPNSNTNRNNRKGITAQNGRSDSSEESLVDGRESEEGKEEDDNSDEKECASKQSAGNSCSNTTSSVSSSVQGISGSESESDHQEESNRKRNAEEDKSKLTERQRKTRSFNESTEAQVLIRTGSSYKRSLDLNENKQIGEERKSGNISQNKMDADRDDGEEDPNPPEAETPAAEEEGEGGEEEEKEEEEDGEAEESGFQQGQGTGQEDTATENQFDFSAASTQPDSTAPKRTESEPSEWRGSEDPEAFRERWEEEEFEQAAANDDIVLVTEKMLSKVQERERLKGVSIPQSRLLRFVAMNLSRLWRRGPDDRLHEFGQWLKEPATPEAIRSIIYNIKRRRFPGDLQRNLAKAVVSVCLEGVADAAMPLTDGLVKAVLERFMSDLEKDEVCMAVLEKVLQAMVEEYSTFTHMDLPFNTSVMVLDCLGFVQELFHSGRVTKRGNLLPAVKNWSSLSSDTRETLECGHWGNLLHRASVVIRLGMLSETDEKNLDRLMKTLCTDLIGPDAPTDLREMLDMTRNRMTVLKYKKAFSIDLSVNVVVTLLQLLQSTKISSTTLLPGATQNTSQSACTENSASMLGPYSTGEAVILLVLDKLASEMGHGSIDLSVQSQIAASVVDLLVTQYGYDREELKGPGLTTALDDVCDQLSCASMGFLDAKRLLAGILRPYLAATVRPLIAGIEPASTAVSLEEEQSRSLLALVTQVFVTFINGVTARLRRGGVKVDRISKKIMSLYTWRAVAGLAGQARMVLSEVGADHENDATTSKVKPSDSLIIERIIRSVVDMEDTNANSEAAQHEPADDGGNEEMFSQFLRAICDANAKPGYIPVTDVVAMREAARNAHKKNNKKSTKDSKHRHNHLVMEHLGDPDDTPDERFQREEKTPIKIDRALRREVIAAARDIGDALVSTRALRQLTAKTADSFAGTVFVMERFLDELYNKLWMLLKKLLRGKTSPDFVLVSLLGPHHCDSIPQLRLNRAAAVKVIQDAITELEGRHAAALTLSRMVESLSRAAHGLLPAEQGEPDGSSHRRRQPHPILASASPLLLSQWVRTCLISALVAFTTVISGGQVTPFKMAATQPGGHEAQAGMSEALINSTSGDRLQVPSKSQAAGKKPKAPQHVDPDAIYLASSYVAVHNMLARARDATERQKTRDGLWHAPRVAGTSESSEVGVPVEVLDRVFARVAGVMQTLAESVSKYEEENDGRVPNTSSDLASAIIAQVTGAINYHVEVGQFPMIRINDLLNPPPPATPKSPKGAGVSATATPNRSRTKVAVSAQPSRAASQPRQGEDAKDISENNRGLGIGNNNNWSLNNSGMEEITLPDPVSLMEGRWSKHLFHSLIDIVGRLDETLKEALEFSLQCRDSVTVDAKVRARAFTSAMLDKIRKNATSQDLLLSNRPEKAQLWKKKQRKESFPTAKPSMPTAALSTATVASPVISRKTSQARVGDRKTASSVNTNVNKASKVPVSTPGRGTEGAQHQSTTKTNKCAVAPKSTGLLMYVRSLLGPVNDANLSDIFISKTLSGKAPSGDVSNNKSLDAISEILRAGFAVSLDLMRSFEKPGEIHAPKRLHYQQEQESMDGIIKGSDLPAGPATSTAVSILVLDLLLEQLTSTLERRGGGGYGVASSTAVGMGRVREPTNAALLARSPYVSSYQYRTPDPYGPFYAEVVDRGRRWYRMLEVNPPSQNTGAAAEVSIPRIHSLTRDLLAPATQNGRSSQDASGLDLTSTTSVSGTQSLRSQPSASSATAGVNGSRTGTQRQLQERRATTWRKEVQKLSVAYGVNNTNNSWQRRSGTRNLDTRGGHRLRGSGEGKRALEPRREKSQQQQPKEAQATAIVGTRNQPQSSNSKTSTAQTSGASGGRGLSTTRSTFRDDNKTPATKAQLLQGPTCKISTASTTTMNDNRSNAGKKTWSAATRTPLHSSTVPHLYRRTSTYGEGGKGREARSRDRLEKTTSDQLQGGDDDKQHEQHPEEREGEEDWLRRADGMVAEAPATLSPPSSSCRWQEPTVQIFYHVSEEAKEEAEEQLKKFKQSKENEDNKAASLPNQDLQLLLLNLLARDLPDEASVLYACLRPGPPGKRLKLSSLADVTDLLSLLDIVLAELPTPVGETGRGIAGRGQDQAIEQQEEDERGDDQRKKRKAEEEEEEEIDLYGKSEVKKIRRLLKEASTRLEVSQRSAGAVHSLLRSVECGFLQDETLRVALKSSTAQKIKDSEVHLNAVKSQLKASLAHLVERLEEGHCPSCMTSTGWTRLAQEILLHSRRKLRAPQGPTEQNTRDGRLETGDDVNEGNMAANDDGPYFDCFKKDGRCATDNVENKNTDTDRKETVVPCHEDESRSVSRSCSRSSSRSTDRASSQASVSSASSRVSECDRSTGGHQRTDRSLRDDRVESANHRTRRNTFSGTGSQEELRSASALSTSRSASSSSCASSKSSRSSATSASCSSSRCSAVSHATRSSASGSLRACSVSSEKMAASAHSKENLPFKPEIDQSRTRHSDARSRSENRS